MFHAFNKSKIITPPSLRKSGLKTFAELKQWDIYKQEMCSSETQYAPYCAALIFFLPLTLKDDLDLERPPLKMCSFMRTPLWKKMTFDLVGWPWPWISTTQNVKLHEIHIVPNIKLLSSILNKVMANVKVFGRTDAKYLTFDLERWPWPSPFIT